ncbi:hypothetical protein [Salibacterium halotolerans]|nr:hypothetical protein [Salibacterium halotolerans]
MRIHIWTASTGSGHNEAARVLQEEWRKQGHTAEIFHPLETGPRVTFQLSKKVYKLLVTGCPPLWRSLSEQKVPYQTAKLPAAWYPEMIQEAIDADAVISVHPFLTALAAAAKTRCPDLLLFHAATDYWHAPAADLPEVNGTFLPAQVTTEQAGTPVFPFGIPAHVRRSSFTKKEYCLANGWNPKKPLILLSGGGEGPFPYHKMLRTLRYLHPLCTIVICSRKWKKARRLMVQGHDVFVYPWMPQFKNYLQVCDVLVTKAGGMTLTEAFLAETPVVITAPLPGQEERNARHALRCQAALQGDRPETVWGHVSTLLQSPFNRERMKRRQKRLQQPGSVKQITETVQRAVTFFDVSDPYIPQERERLPAESGRAEVQPVPGSDSKEE